MGVKAIHQSPVWMAGGSRFPTQGDAKNETHNILRLALFLPPTSFIILRSSSEHTCIFGIHAVKQKLGLTDSLMRQKGAHVILCVEQL